MILKHFIGTAIVGLSLVSINASGAVVKMSMDNDSFMQSSRTSLKQLVFHTAPSHVFSDTDLKVGRSLKLHGTSAMFKLSLVNRVNSGGLRRFHTKNLLPALPLVGADFDLDRISLARETVVPVPAAAWLFGSGLLGLVGFARRKARG